MMPLHLLIRHEWRQIRRRRATWLIGAALGLTMALATVHGRHVAQEARVEAARHLSRADEVLPPAQAAHPGRQRDVAVLPVAPLAALSIGQSDLLPRVVAITTLNKQRTPEDRYGFENPDLLALARLDPATVLVLLVPLVAIAFSHDWLSAEREAGTLLLVQAAGVGPGTLLMAKALPAAVLLTVVTLTPVVLLAPETVASGSLPGLAWMLIVVLYAIVWLAAAAAVNARGWSSARNLTVLTGLWVTIVLLGPSLLHLGATIAAPIPSRLEAVTASREDPQVFVPAIPRLAEAWYREHPDLRSASRQPSTVQRTFDAGFFLVQHTMDQQAAPYEQAVETALARQQSLVRRWSVLCPAVAVREALDHLAGTSVDRYQAFRLQAETYRTAWRRFFGQRILHGQRLTDADHVARPRFRFVEDPRDPIRRAGWTVASLALWALVFAGAAGWRLRL